MIYFISCITSEKQLGAMQFESTKAEFQAKAEKLCPEKAEFKAYELKEFEKDLPIDEFVPTAKLKELGY